MATIETTTTWNQTHTHPFQFQPKKRLDRWKVCVDFQNGNCDKKENDCEFAHPSSQKEIRAGIVTVCMDHVNDQCVRPNCKYLHPPTHICAQIHDHKKRPYPARSRSTTSTDGEHHVFTSHPEDFLSQYQYPYQFFYPNTQPGPVYFPHFSNNQLNIPGQGFGSSHQYQSQLSTGIQESGEEQSSLQSCPDDPLQYPMCQLFLPQFYPPIITN
ncbi:Muscleblind-like protein 1 isoform X4 [Oopsacas minuta]|uniref:Muscleblind-like protein 1 isoform X4 n=1 Tax=Oopsacas minuta TaxID=111878 RepID=A0AAV7K1U0_9METZ|nr:Muscleblind-like protein 1 isoform X4 [Oopsacas minuta]